MKTGGKTENGSILIIVLWWLVILTILTIAVYAAVRPRLGFAGRLKDRAVSQYRATAAIQLALAVLGDDQTPGYDALNDPWSNSPGLFRDAVLGRDRFTLAHEKMLDDRDEVTILYGLTDEESKININRADREVLQDLFVTVAGLGGLEADPIVSAIIDWRDRDDEPEKYGAEDTHYKSLSPPYPCKNDAFQLPEELLLVKGITPALFSAVEPHITVYGSGAVNMNTASETVLRCLGLSDRLIRGVLRCRRGGDGLPGTEDDVPFETVSGIVDTMRDEIGLSTSDARELSQFINGHRITVRSDNFRGRVYETLDNSVEGVHITFVFNRNGVVRLWREF